MKKSDLKTIVKECMLDILNEVNTAAIETASDNFGKWLKKSPSIAQNLAKLRAEKVGAGSTWGVFLYDNRGNKMLMAGGMTPQAAKALLPLVKDEIMGMIPQQPQLPTGPTPPMPSMPPGQPTAPGQPPPPAGGTNTDTTMFMKKEDREMEQPSGESKNHKHDWKFIRTGSLTTVYKCKICGKVTEV